MTPLELLEKMKEDSENYQIGENRREISKEHLADTIAMFRELRILSEGWGTDLVVKVEHLPTEEQIKEFET
jgi:hypothetical protein